MGVKRTLVGDAAMSAFDPKRTLSSPGHCPVERQRNGREEYVVGIIMPLSFDEPFGIAAVAFQHTIVTCGEQIRIGTGKRHRFKARTCGANPTLILPLLKLVRPVDETTPPNGHPDMSASEAISAISFTAAEMHCACITID